MIVTALNAGSDGAIKLGLGPTYGIMLALLVSHGIVCSFKTGILARLNVYYVILNRASRVPSGYGISVVLTRGN